MRRRIEGSGRAPYMFPTSPASSIISTVTIQRVIEGSGWVFFWICVCVVCITTACFRGGGTCLFYAWHQINAAKRCIRRSAGIGRELRHQKKIHDDTNSTCLRIVVLQLRAMSIDSHHCMPAPTFAANVSPSFCSNCSVPRALPTPPALTSSTRLLSLYPTASLPALSSAHLFPVYVG